VIHRTTKARPTLITSDQTISLGNDLAEKKLGSTSVLDGDLTIPEGHEPKLLAPTIAPPPVYTFTEPTIPQVSGSVSSESITPTITEPPEVTGGGLDVQVDAVPRAGSQLMISSDFNQKDSAKHLARLPTGVAAAKGTVQSSATSAIDAVKGEGEAQKRTIQSHVDKPVGVLSGSVAASVGAITKQRNTLGRSAHSMKNTIIVLPVSFPLTSAPVHTGRRHADRCWDRPCGTGGGQRWCRSDCCGCAAARTLSVAGCVGPQQPLHRSPRPRTEAPPQPWELPGRNDDQCLAHPSAAPAVMREPRAALTTITKP
jgi:hypothetical protein